MRLWFNLTANLQPSSKLLKPGDHTQNTKTMSRSLGKIKAFRCEFHETHDVRTAPLNALDLKTNKLKFSQPFYVTYTSMCYTHKFTYKKDLIYLTYIKVKELIIKNKTKKVFIILKSNTAKEATFLLDKRMNIWPASLRFL